jgi:UDP:flavonoid glycosyltransferase YjiC (YdhE family)
VGALTLELATTADDEVATWIADGKPPIYFGFGSTPVESPSETLSMISAACADLDERALICSGWSDFTSLSTSEHVKVVPAVNFATTFPACRAVVHHGGAGTTAAALRAGVPSMILWTLPDQPIWAAQIKRMKVGDGRRFTHTTRETLVGDLSRILAPEYVSRAREIATRMSDPAASVVSAADLVEDFARRGRLG